MLVKLLSLKVGLLAISLSLGWYSIASAQVSVPFPKIQDEFNGPFKSWLNVKKDFGAKGDGRTDDTRSLQAALDAAGKGTVNSTLYLPGGVYRITATLKLNFQINVSVIGADPLKTTILWDGPAHGTMLQLNGTAYSKFDRLGWNGANIAGIAVDQSWDGSKPHFDTANEYADDIFTDVGFGIRGGALGHGFAETTILRCHFIRNSQAGISLGNFNALDIWVRNCLFEDCNMGVTNTFGAGNFKVYECLFRHSKQGDICMGNTGEFSVRGNTSIGSAQFFNAGSTRNPAAIIIEGNTILDTTNPVSVFVGNQGPVIFVQNSIRSHAPGPVARFDSHTFCSRNTFTTTEPLLTGDHSLVSNNTIITADRFPKQPVPASPAAAPYIRRKIFEVPPGADSRGIQAAINQAARISGQRPVVHLPFGQYQISNTLIIPQGADLQLTGDGFGDQKGTFLNWAGTIPAPVIRIDGPNRSTLRDLTIKGDKNSINIQLRGCDQTASLVQMQAFHQIGGDTGLLSKGLSYLRVYAYDGGFSGLQTAVSVIGGKAGRNTESQTIIYNGAESGNSLSHEIKNSGRLVVQDSWYEGGNKSTYASLTGNGTFTASGNHIATPNNSDAIWIHDFSGQALFSANDLSGHFAFSGNNRRAQLLALALFTENDSFIDKAAAGKAGMQFLLGRGRNHGSAILYGGSIANEDLGSYQPARDDQLLYNSSQPPGNAGQTYIRLYRIMSIGGRIGLDIEP